MFSLVFVWFILFNFARRLFCFHYFKLVTFILSITVTHACVFLFCFAPISFKFFIIDFCFPYHFHYSNILCFFFFC